MQPQLIIEQKITALANKYVVFKANPDGSKGELLALAQQKRFAFKEKVNFYSDESKTTEVFSFRAEKAMDIHGKFFVEDPSGERLGMFRKDFKKSLLNSTWHILDKDENSQLTINESSPALAALRRFVGFIPFVGELLDLIIAFVKYHFVYRNPCGEEVARYQKTKLFRDHYLFSADSTTMNTVDWRVLASMAVALDALQGR